MQFSLELGLIFAFSILGGVLAVRFKQPSVIGLILAGALIGPHNLGMIQDTGLIDSSIEIGAILLLFTVGIEFSLQHLFNLGFRVVTLAVMKLGIVFLLSYYTSFLLGFNVITSLYIGVILSITSTVIVIKVLEQKGLSKKEELPLLIAVLIIEDIFAVFALTFFSGLNTSLDLKPFGLLTKLVISLIVLLVAYTLLKNTLNRMIKWLIKYSAEETLTFMALGLCVFMSFIASALGLSPSVGAFLAGNIVSSFPKSKSFQKSIHPFILTFTSLFFFSIGTIVDLKVVFGAFFIVLVLFMVNTLAKMLAIGLGSYTLTNLNGRQAIFSGIAMISVGEFSLLIAKEASSLNLGVDLVSITASIILLSSLAMSFFVTHTDSIYNVIVSFLPSGFRKTCQDCSKFMNTVSWTIVRDRVLSRKIRIEWKTIINNFFALFFVFATAFLFWAFFNDVLISILGQRPFAYALSILFFFAIFFPTLKIMRNLSDLWKNISAFFVGFYPKEIANEKKILRNFILLGIMFFLMILAPALIILLGLHPIYHAVVGFLTMGVLLYIVNSSGLIIAIIKRHKSKFESLSLKYKNLFKNG